MSKLILFFTKKPVFTIAIVLVIVLVIVFLTRKRKKSITSYGTIVYDPANVTPTENADYPKEGNTPSQTSYNPNADVVRLYNAMKGWGTDENTIWDVLGDKNGYQLAAIKNRFDDLYKVKTGKDLFAWLESDLDSSDLNRAMSYFRAWKLA